MRSGVGRGGEADASETNDALLHLEEDDNENILLWRISSIDGGYLDANVELVQDSKRF